MRGNIEVNGKKMTSTEFVELFFETEDKVKERDLQIKKLQKELEELETELRVKDDLLKIQSGLKNGEFSKIVEIDGEHIKLTHTESGAVKISNLPYKEESRPSIEWYECEMMKGLEEISRQKAIIDNLIETIYLLRME